MSHTLRIHYPRDFDGMVSAAVLAKILTETREEQVVWSSVNYDQRRDWLSFGGGERFVMGGIVAALFAVPGVNFLAPFLGAAMATHLVHGKAR